MNILVLSGYDDAMKEVGDRCTATHKRYAELHGYAHEVVRHFRADAHPSYQKIELLQARIHSYDAIVWLDADSVVMNMDVRVEDRMSLDRIMTISADWCCPIGTEEKDLETLIGVSCGNFIVRNAEGVDEFLKRWAAPNRWRIRPMWEQSQLREVMEKDPWMSTQVKRLPRWAMNSVDVTCVNRAFEDAAPFPYKEGDWIYHLTNVDRIKILDELGL